MKKLLLCSMVAVFVLSGCSMMNMMKSDSSIKKSEKPKEAKMKKPKEKEVIRPKQSHSFYY